MKLIQAAILILGSSLYSQLSLPSVTPPPPEAYAIFKSTEIPVSHTTGIPQISIPVHQINLKDFTLPISIDYNSSGIKVAEISSSVGLGWSLNAGGMISTMVVGNEDFTQQDYMDVAVNYPEDRQMIPQFSISNGARTTNTDYDICFLLSGNRVDSNSGLYQNSGPVYNMDPDIFFYKFGSESGKFFFTRDGSVAPVPYRPIKIERTPTFFKITDEKGIVYTFGALESLATSTQSFSGYPEFGGGGSGSYSRSFYLTQIETPHHEIIQFNYNNVSYKYNSPNTYTRYKGGSSWGFPSDVEVTNNHSNTIQGKILKSIIYKNQEIKFKYDSCPRLDLLYSSGQTGGFALNEIEVLYNQQSEKRAILNHSYFNYSGTNYCLTPNESYRLKLNSINIEGQPPYLFEYYGSNSLPLRTSAELSDHWGYYKVGGGKYPKDYQFSFYDGGNRDPNLENTKLGTLSKIIYPTGGRSEFEYELNEYYGEKTIYSEGQVSYNGVQLYYDEFSSEQQVTFEITNNTIQGSILIQYNTPAPPLVADPQFNIYLTGNGTNRGFQSNGSPQSQTINLSPGFYTLRIEQVGVFEEGFATVTWTNSVPGSSQIETGNFKTGGLRVKSIKDYDHNATVYSKAKYFEYNNFSDSTKSSGLISNYPTYMFPHTQTRQTIEGDGFIIRTNAGYQVQNSTTVQPLNGMQGYHIMYSNVRVFEDDLRNSGYTDFTYSFTQDIDAYVTYPPTPVTSFDWMRGLLIEQKNYKKELSGTYSLIKSLQNNYFFNYTPPSGQANSESGGAHFTPASAPNEKHALALKINLKYPEAVGVGSQTIRYEGAIFEVSAYKLISSWYYLQSSIETLFPSGQDPIVNKTVYHFENPIHSQLSKLEKYTSNQENQLITYKYPIDITSNSSLGYDLLSASQMTAVNQLKSDNIISKVLQETLYLDSNKNGIPDASEQKSTQRTNYVLDSGIVQPSTIQTLKGVYNSTNNKLETRIEYLSYDIYGNPTEVKKSDGASVSYLWGYNGQYFLAKIENATQSEVTATGVNQSILTNPSSTDAQRTTELNKVRNGLSNAMVTTYEFKPLVGVTKITDPRGEELNYDYDDFNRLEAILDDDLNLLEEYKYNYRSN